MDFAPHWATSCKCNVCGEIPDTAPLYHCPLKHQFCLVCYEELKRNYKGTTAEGSTCPSCQFNGKFERSRINTDFLRKLKIKPGIGRPYRYSSKIVQAAKQRNNFTATTEPQSEEKNHKHSFGEPHNVTVEDLFQLPSNQVQRLLRKKSYRNVQGETVEEEEEFEEEEEDTAEPLLEPIRSETFLLAQSKKPLQCPHSHCNKTIAVSAFANHFRYEHKDIKTITSERGKVTTISVDAAAIEKIEHGVDVCVAMITIYERNKIDLTKSKSSRSVLRTCNKFQQSVPVDTFWVMVSGSEERNEHLSYVFYWVFTNTDDSYRCTIELASKKDTINVSTFCYVNSTTKETFSNLPENVNCLILGHNVYTALLKEGVDVKLRVTIH
ncbi:unnamed protein product [Brassicogethes aeneus]|uniref:RING-type domain-containing protein n=1 Tax=Brassicogethes aeneus TaxID=1431903 RepID=A0A9P0B3T7_BRAAE|nr:unnamed protein product [Brassicogethes aeneus]